MKKIILKLSGLKLLTALLGLVYSILQIRFFGATALVDAYFVAISGVYLLISLTQSGQLAEVFLPEYLKMKHINGRKAAFRLFSALINRLVVYVFVALIITYIITPVLIKIMGPGLAPEYKEIAVRLFRLALALVILTVISAFTNTVLNAEEVYGRSEFTGIINSVISIFLISLFYKKFGIDILVYSLLAGKLVEFAMGIVFLKRLDFKYSLAWKVKGFNFTGFFKVLGTTTLYVGSTQVFNVVLTAMASFLPSGTLSIFKYVQQLSTKASGLVMGPIATIYFSKFSIFVSQGKQNLSEYLKKPIFWISIIMVIFLCGGILLGKEALQILWSKKSLLPKEFNLAYIMLIMNFTGLVFSSAGQIFRKSAVALGYAQKLYKRWIYVQLFTSTYTFIAIYFTGIYGLASIPVINMFLLALVSFYTAQKSGVDCMYILKSIFGSTLIFFLSILVISSILLALLFPFFIFSLIELTVIKLVLYGLIIGILSLSFLRKEIVLIMNKNDQLTYKNIIRCKD